MTTEPVDPIFGDDRLAPLYDVFDGARDDLAAYLSIVRELRATTLLDIGCGTGSFAVLAAADGVRVAAVDPARASVDVARGKPGADRVGWHVGTAADAPLGPYDVATMTGNVAQVFLADDDWLATLRAVRDRLVPTGHLVFETRRPDARAWEAWAEPYESVTDVAGVGRVRQRRRLLGLSLPSVSFRWDFEFADGTVVHSDSTLRFRSDEDNQRLLRVAGFEVVEVRDAPDRPRLEFVYVARRIG